jgi:hypothetical protein
MAADDNSCRPATGGADVRRADDAGGRIVGVDMAKKPPATDDETERLYRESLLFRYLRVTYRHGDAIDHYRVGGEQSPRGAKMWAREAIAILTCVVVVLAGVSSKDDAAGLGVVFREDTDAEIGVLGITEGVAVGNGPIGTKALAALGGSDATPILFCDGVGLAGGRVGLLWPEHPHARILTAAKRVVEVSGQRVLIDACARDHAQIMRWGLAGILNFDVEDKFTAGNGGRWIKIFAMGDNVSPQLSLGGSFTTLNEIAGGAVKISGSNGQNERERPYDDRGEGNQKLLVSLNPFDEFTTPGSNKPNQATGFFLAILFFIFGPGISAFTDPDMASLGTRRTPLPR